MHDLKLTSVFPGQNNRLQTNVQAFSLISETIRKRTNVIDDNVPHGLKVHIIFDMIFKRIERNVKCFSTSQLSKHNIP